MDLLLNKAEISIKRLFLLQPKSEKMIIGYEAKRVFQNCSGLGNYGRNTISLLARYYPESKYKLFAPRFTELYKIPSAAEIITPQTFFSQLLTSYWRLRQIDKLLKCNKIDVFHGLSHVLPFGIEKTGIPSVVTMHDLIFLRYPEYYKRIDRNMYEAIYRSSCQRATKIIAISNQTKADLISFFGIKAGKIEVIYQSCNKLFYDKVSEEQKAAVQLKFNLPEKFILSVGTIERRKNQLAILKAVVKEKLGITVVILGKPTEYISQLNQFISESNISKQVLFLHQTTTAELQAIYQMAEVMVYPSFFEGFGLPVLEAQASGCAVITSDISSLPEAGGDGARYVNPEDISQIGTSINDLLSDTQLRKKLILKGMANATLFSEEIVAKKLMKLYLALMQKV
jgi:glycosyltransferase involved in cell wall biosynthesis